MTKKIRIAFIKYAGLTSGGSEKLAQIIAAYLPKDRFEVDFFACDPSPLLGPQVQQLPTSPERIKFLLDHGVTIKKFKVQSKDLRTYTVDWLGTDFWEIFDERNYDLIQTSRSGHKEYPFYKIRHTPIVDILNLSAGVDNQYNISRVMHLNKWIAEQWIKKGGDPSRVEIVSLPIQIEKKDWGNFRLELGLENKFIFGFHQRPDNDIFSPIPLEAYKKIESDKTSFLILGGGDNYKKQAKELGIAHINFLPPTADMDVICKFLNTLNVFAHGRKDGEVNSQAMAEAMYFGLPIVSHYSEQNNGHVENIAEAGKVVRTAAEYSEELVKLLVQPDYFSQKQSLSKARFQQKYELQGQMKNFIRIYENVISNPFPHKFKRILWSLHYTQNIRIWLAQIYLKLKFGLGWDLLANKK